MTVLVTGAFGLVGSATVKRLAADGRHVVATDLDNPANRKAATSLGDKPGVDVRWADLTDAASVDALVAAVSPTAIVHLAAIIPPLCYARRTLARKVNVDTTASLVRAAEAQPSPPRFVQASSIAVYGARNPHRHTDLLSAATPVRPSDNYGAHKVEVEEIVRTSSLDWVVLRLGGVLTVEPPLNIKLDMLQFEQTLPTDGRIQTVDVRDVAAAFIAATATPATKEVLLIGGDGSHRLRQGEIAQSTAAAMGLVHGLPTGRRGNPDSDTDWFATDWMDTSRAQEVLSFQQHSWPDMLVEMADKIGWKRYLLRVIAPLTRMYLQSHSPYRGYPGVYADPWGAIRAKWDDPGP